MRLYGDELGAHVSSAGGVQNAPGRAALLDAHVLQLFTKMASRWAEPVISDEQAEAFKQGCAEHGITFTAAHDSYLINLATADAALFERSYASFVGELARSTKLGLTAVVTHPGNATDGDVARGVRGNAQAVQRALDAVPGSVLVLFETTAGSGNALGASFEQLAELIYLIDESHRERIGVCVDTCHVWAAGYDVRDHYDDVIHSLDEIVGMHRVRMFHLNDSVGDRGSRRDRHAHIGEGLLGKKTFASLVNDPRFRSVPKMIETPKDDDVLAADRKNLGLLRSLRRKTGARKSKNA
ncbi:MAG TPA: deoxyribonuclease IV [Longimicrobiales bacterium]